MVMHGGRASVKSCYVWAGDVDVLRIRIANQMVMSTRELVLPNHIIDCYKVRISPFLSAATW